MREESKKLIEAMKDHPLYYKGTAAGDENFEGIKIVDGFFSEVTVGHKLSESHTFNKTYYSTTTYHGGGDGTADESWSNTLDNAGVNWSYHNVSLTFMGSSSKHYAETTCTATANGTVNWSASDYYKVYPYNAITITSHGFLYIKKNDEFVVEALDLGTTEGLNSSSGSIDVVNGDIITAYFLGADDYSGINTGSFIDLEMKLVETEYNVTSTSDDGDIVSGVTEDYYGAKTAGFGLYGNGYVKFELLYCICSVDFRSSNLTKKNNLYIKKDGKEYTSSTLTKGIYEIWVSKDFNQKISSNSTDTVKSIIDEFSVNVAPAKFELYFYNSTYTVCQDIVTCIEDLNIGDQVVIPIYMFNNECKNNYGATSIDSLENYKKDIYLEMEGATYVQRIPIYENIKNIEHLTLYLKNVRLETWNKKPLFAAKELTINKLVNCDMKQAFCDCSELESVDVTNNAEISFRYTSDFYFMFKNCKTLAQNLGRDGIVNLEKQLGVCNHSLFFDCPYNKTIPSKYASFECQSSHNFAPEYLLYIFLSQGFFNNVEDDILGTDTTTTTTTISANPSDIFKYQNNNFYINFITNSTYQSFWPDIFAKIKTIMELCSLDKFDLCCNYQDSNLSYDSNGADSAKNFNTMLKEAKTTDLCDIYCTSISTTSVFNDRNCDGLFDGISNLIRIGDPQYYCCKASGFNSMKRTFANCKNIDMVGLITNCDNVDEMFYGTNYTSVSVETKIKANSAKRIFATSGVNNTDVTNTYTHLYAKDLTQAFYQCPNITQISANVFNDTTEIIQDAFAECPNLVSVEGDWVDPNSSLYYQNYTIDEVTSKNVASFNDPTTKSGFSIPSSVTNAYGLFRDCSNLTTVRNLKLSTGINDYLFQNDTVLQTLENVYLNESGSYTGIFDGAAQNSTWKIWCPRYIKNKVPYNTGSDNIFGTGLDPEKVPVLWVDDGYITINGEFINVQSLRRLNYVNTVDPDKKYAWKFFTHPYVLTAEHFGYNKMTDTTIYYGNKNN